MTQLQNNLCIQKHFNIVEENSIESNLDNNKNNSNNVEKKAG